MRKSTHSNLILVGKSSIHGKGVFGAEHISKGVEIIEYTGKKVFKKEGDRRADNQLAQGKLYVFELNKRYDIDGLDGGSDARFINHSCDPNCESITYNNKNIWIVSTKPIKKGEEIFYDYELTGDKEMTCGCGSKKCRKKL